MRQSRSPGSRAVDFFSSIRFRLTLWFVLILAVVLAIFSAFIYASQSRDLRVDAVQGMQSKLSRLQDYFQSEAWQNSTLSPAQVPDTNDQVPLQPGDFMLVSTTGGQILQDWGAKPQDPPHLVGGLISASAASQNRDSGVYQQTIAVTDQSNRTSNSSYLFLVIPVLRHNTLVGFLVLGSPSPLAAQLRKLSISLLLGSLGMLVIAFIGGLWLADRAMRPVKSIAQTARSISETDLSRRLNLRGRDELAQLGGTFDNMLARLQTAFERQRRFVADASHELRTPLTIVNLEVGRVLSGSRKTAEYKHALQVVDLESTRMTRLVNDLMTLARMDNGQTILQHEKLDLSEVAVEAYERMLPLARRHQIALDIGDMSDLPVNGDRQYLLQMISNLIENAIKYSEADGHVRIETEPANSNEHPVALLRVTDTGPGIPAEHLPHLFERFYRADASRARDPQEDSASPTGTGLGLSIVAWIVESHGGHIEVRSEIGKGTTFDVALPLVLE
ncbi:MAG TPA: ATP-binding protein [Anaerolineales bacterium]|nr:ATP-binding protein [Anaerolineales bacterium]